MRRTFWVLLCLCVLAGAALAQYGQPAGQAAKPAAKPDFDITASYIEACSCDMFCPCYFNDHPTQHGAKHFCEGNLVMKVDKGYYKTTKLDGVKVWIATDLGAEWGHGKGDWIAFTFDPGVTEAQKNAMLDILPQLYPLKFNVLGVDASPIEWRIDDATGTATARLGNGKGEVVLARWQGDDPKKEAILHNVKYWSAQSNTGFRMWKNKVHRYDGHGKKFNYAGTNGFLITIHFSGQASKKAAAD